MCNTKFLLIRSRRESITRLQNTCMSSENYCLAAEVPLVLTFPVFGRLTMWLPPVASCRLLEMRTPVGTGSQHVTPQDPCIFLRCFTYSIFEESVASSNSYIWNLFYARKAQSAIQMKVCTSDKKSLIQTPVKADMMVWHVMAWRHGGMAWYR